jgi:ubiquinone/menaquinone biosynthesis C-methylase UbiE
MMRYCLVLLTAIPVAYAFVPVAHDKFGKSAIRLQYAKDGAVGIGIVGSDIDTVTKSSSSSLSPGLAENDKFVCDKSVEYWRNFQSNGFDSDMTNAQSVAQISSRFITKGPKAISYWMRHLGRTGYFTTNAVLGVSMFQLNQSLFAVNNKKKEDEVPRFKSELLWSGASRLILEAAICYEQDYEQIEKGIYKEPWDMNPTHRQSTPQNILTQTNRFVRDSIGVLGRRVKGETKDKKIDFVRAGLKVEEFPKYYETAFHYQNNGWLSKDSADVYEVSTETLFLGRQDAMQRTSLPALMDRAKQVRDRPLKVLEVACGTGRFMTFARDSLPLDTEYTAVDLSPYYLDAARDNDDYWTSTRKSRENSHTKSIIRPANIVQAMAEKLPFDDDTFDAVICIYLFHELPQAIRARAAAEMARVVRPNGGTVIFTDSIQKGDRPILDDSMGNFGKMNEPYYVNYIQDDLPKHFENAGLVCKTKIVSSSTKSLSFEKK